MFMSVEILKIHVYRFNDNIKLVQMHKIEVVMKNIILRQALCTWSKVCRPAITFQS